MVLPRTASKPEMELEWKIPEKSNAIERDRARAYHEAYSALIGLHNLERALGEVRAGRTKSWSDFKVPDEAVSCGFHEAARGVLSHHMVIRGGKVANYQPYPPTPWNGNPRDSYGTPGPYEDAVENTPIFEENGPDNFKGVDIMRAVQELRPLPPVRRPHVHGQGSGDEGRPQADRARLGRPMDASIASAPNGAGPADSSEELLDRVQRLSDGSIGSRTRGARRRPGTRLGRSRDAWRRPGEDRRGARRSREAPGGGEAEAGRRTVSSPACC